LPKNDTVRRAIQCARTTTTGTPAEAAAATNPESLEEDLDIPEEYKLHNGSPFLLADSGAASGGNNSRILIFGKESNKYWVAQAKHLFIYDTVCSTIFSQQHQILALKCGDHPSVTPIF
jgi:hypothetical protein